MSTPTIRSIELLRLIPLHPRRTDVSRLQEQLHARGLGTTRRQLRRVLAELARHYPLDCDDRDKPFGWCWMEGSSPPVVGAIDVPTAVALILASQRLLDLLPSGMQGALAPLLNASRRALQDVPRRLDRRIASTARGLRLSRPLVQSTTVERLAQALAEGAQVRLQFVERGTDRQVALRTSPLGLVARAERLYLVHRPQATPICTTALHRVSSCELVDAVADERDFDLREWIDAGGLDRRIGEGELELVLRLSPAAASAFVDSPLTAEQTVEREAGAVVVRARLHDSHALRTFLLGFGSECVVLAPTSLRGWFAAEVATLGRAYGSDSLA